MDWLTLILTMVVGVLGVYYFVGRNLRKLERLGILHKKPWPVVGNFGPAIFGRCSQTETVDHVYRMNQDAKYVGFYCMSEPVIMLRSPELIKSIGIKDFEHFVDHWSFLDPDLDPLIGNGPFVLTGGKWKEIRHLLTRAFTISKLRSMFHLMSNCAKNYTDHLAAQVVDGTSDLDTKESFATYANDVVAICAFGLNIDSIKNPENDFYRLGRTETHIEGLRSIKLFVQNSFPNMSKLFNIRFIQPSTDKFFTDVVKETIDTRDREGITRPDVLQLLMDSRGTKFQHGTELTIPKITAQLFGIFFASFDTMTTAMSFAAYEIAVNEDVQKKLQEEVDEIMVNCNGEPTYDALNEMQYLEAVLSEALRLYPPGRFLDRLCVKKFELPPALPGGKSVTIEAGQHMWLPAYCIHRDSKYFPEPNKFDPERFMGSRKKDIEPCTYFPFGLGPRMCLGYKFGMLQMKVAFFYLLSKCHLKPSSKTRVPLKWSKRSFALSPEGGFWIQIEPRSTATEK